MRGCENVECCPRRNDEVQVATKSDDKFGRAAAVALVVVTMILAGCGKDAAYYVDEGDAYVAQGDMANAAIAYEKAVEIAPDDYDAHNSLGAVLSSMGDFNRAIDHFRLAISLNDSLVEGHYNLGRAYAETGKFQEALSEFWAAAHLDSTYALAYMSGGAVFDQIGLREQAIDSYERAIRADPNLIQARVNLASVYMAMEEYDKGIGVLLEARDLLPANPDLASLAGRAAILKRDFDQAVDLFGDAVRLDSTSIVHRNDLATALMLAERKDEAITQWERILTLNPDPQMERVVRQNLARAREE
jgi:tetratricopeptide (TPR) repeat protein